MRRVLTVTAALAVALAGVLPAEHVHFDGSADHPHHALLHRHFEDHQAEAPASHEQTEVAASHGTRIEVLTTWILGTDRFVQRMPAAVIAQGPLPALDFYRGPILDSVRQWATHDPPRGSLSFRGPPFLR